MTDLRQAASPRARPRRRGKAGRLVLVGLLLCAGLAGSAAAQAVRQPAAPAYDVVAVRVEFQPDTTRFTTGDGTFGGDLFGGLRPTIDPLPHDAGYFQAHLDFLADYVARASDGQTTVRTHLLPEVVRVSRPMGDYSPTGLQAGSDAELAKLARLVEEAWRRAAAQGGTLPPLNPARTAFVLFHAGVGRDLELTNTSFDRTPLDLPSIFFGEAALQRLLGPGALPTVGGVPVANTLVMPRTETRRARDFIEDEPFLAEFSINGLLAASFFNFLGVPDLFNTRTGESGIGPFGLMDPEGIFAFNGLFPPEPSAWTKYFLGWTAPRRLDAPQNVSLRAASLPNSTDAALVPISASEYFLVENRHRDPEGDGLVLRIWKEGVVSTQRFTNADTSFTRFNVDGFAGGVVVGVDNYDWALPGGRDEEGGVLNGGILVWHVDEDRLREGLAANAVNADPRRRGVDLEEADGAQDIGFTSTLSTDFSRGTPFDFFFAGNDFTVRTASGREVKLYQNRFGPDTTPSSASNAGGPSFALLDGFSEAAPVMSFSYSRVEAGGLAPPVRVDGLLPALAPGSALFGEGGTRFLWEAGSGRVVAFEAGGIGDRLSGVASKPVLLPGGALLAAKRDGSLWRSAGPDDSTAVAVPREPRPLASPLVGAGAGVFYAAVAARPELMRVEVTAQGPVVSVVALPAPARTLGAAPGGPAVGTASGVAVLGGQAWTVPLSDTASPPVFGLTAAGETLGVVTERGGFVWLLPEGAVRQVAPEGRWPVQQASLPVLADLDADGRLDALSAAGDVLIAVDQGGALLAGYPLRLPAAPTGQPLLARDADGLWIFLAGEDGVLYGVRQPPAGGPRLEQRLPVGGGVPADPLLDTHLTTVSATGTLLSWALPGALAPLWSQRYGDARNAGVAGPPPAPPAAAAALLVGEETYNWPNPVRGATYLRWRVSRPARVTITIVDGGGARVDELAFEDVPAGVSMEQVWDRDVPSGVYYARIRAVDRQGREAVKLIKMAVIR